MERNDAHVVLLEQGIVTARTVRRLIEQHRYDGNLMSKLSGNVGDPMLSQAALLAILPDIRAERENETNDGNEMEIGTPQLGPGLEGSEVPGDS